MGCRSIERCWGEDGDGKGNSSAADDSEWDNRVKLTTRMAIAKNVRNSVIGDGVGCGRVFLTERRSAPSFAFNRLESSSAAISW